MSGPTDPALRALVDGLRDALIDACTLLPADRYPLLREATQRWYTATDRDIASALAAAEAAPPTETTFAWLIERGQPEGQVPTVWWVDRKRWGLTHMDEWTEDAFKARQFDSRESAEAVIASKFTPPPSRGGPSARAVQHGFIGPAAEAAPPEEPTHRPTWQDDAPDGWCECGQPNGHTVPNVDCTPPAAEAAPLDVERLAKVLHLLAPLRIEDAHAAPSPGCEEYARLIAAAYDAGWSDALRGRAEAVLLDALVKAQKGLAVLHSTHFGWGCNTINCSGQEAIEAVDAALAATSRGGEG